MYLGAAHVHCTAMCIVQLITITWLLLPAPPFPSLPPPHFCRITGHHQTSLSSGLGCTTSPSGSANERMCERTRGSVDMGTAGFWKGWVVSVGSGGCTTLPLPEIHTSAFSFLSFCFISSFHPSLRYPRLNRSHPFIRRRKPWHRTLPAGQHSPRHHRPGAPRRWGGPRRGVGRGADSGVVVARAGREASQSSQGLSGDHDQDRRPGGNPSDSNFCMLTNPFSVLISPQK